MEQLSLNKKTKSSFLLDAILAILILYLAVINIYSGHEIEGRSMQPTFYDGEKILLNHYMGEPQKDDIIVFFVNGRETLYIKRVIATEGDTFKFVQDEESVFLYYEVDGEWIIREDGFEMNYYAFINHSTQFTLDIQYTVPQDKFFVMGDNRNDSSDSRAIGYVAKRDILGKVITKITNNVFLLWLFF